ncbi:MAG: WYL domain-containing protein, partial [Sandaracinaceae bacterium]|nr:WYL domain-containing protein [Sandaracinaceae bacterium]
RTPIRLAPARGSREAILGAIDDAIQSGHRVRIEVRVASRGGKRERYVIEPITVRVAAGEPYVDAWSVAKNALRTFKLARIERALVLDERAAPHSDVDLDEVFAHAVKTWSGDVTRVRIRIAADVAWAVPEYPLAPSQSILREPDGLVIVEADVAGLVEASRWALGWGRHAEALEPSALRERVRAELSGALARYDAHEVRSRIVSEPAPATPAAPPRRRPRSTARTTQVRGSK